MERVATGSVRSPKRFQRGRHGPTTWWVLAKDGDYRTGLLNVDRGGDRALPVFSAAEDAALFVRFGGASEGGWQVRETSVGELISVLCGPCANVRAVALDPSPVMEAEMIGLVSVDRERFLDWIFAPRLAVSLGSRDVRP